MRLQPILCAVALSLGAPSLPAQVLRVGDLTTRQIRALDRAHTVVLLQGGMLEEHGPYLPSSTDAILSARLTDDIARGVAAQRPVWTVLVFPPVSVGASGSNEIGAQFVFPGTYTVRPSTLRATYMDLATELGEQGFRWIMVVNIHGSPMHIAAIDDAGDYFHDTYGGRMVNLWGLLPVLTAWGSAMSVMSPAQRQEDGVSLHGGADEASLMLYLAPNLVAKDVGTAPPVTGASFAEAFAAAHEPGWPGYLGSPRIATAALGQRIWSAFSGAALTTTLAILDGTDPSTYPRYVGYLVNNPLYQGWIRAAAARDSATGAREQAWSAKHPLLPARAP